MQMQKLNRNLPGWKNCQAPQPDRDPPNLRRPSQSWLPLLSLTGLLTLLHPGTLPPLAAAPPITQTTVLTQWKYDPKLNRLEIAVRDAITPRYFLLAQPARIILDLPNTEIGKVETQKTYPGAVRQIRVSQFQPGLTRIVMELSSSVELAAPQVKLEPTNAKGSSARAWVLQPLLAKAPSPVTTPASIPQRSTAQPPVSRPALSQPSVAQMPGAQSSVLQATVVPSTALPPETAIVVPVSPLAQPPASTPVPATLPALPPATPRVTPPVPTAPEPALPPAILPSTTAVTVKVPSAANPPAIAQPNVPPVAGVVGSGALPYGTPLPPATTTATIPPRAAAVPALPPALPPRANPSATPRLLIFGQPLPKSNTPR